MALIQVRDLVKEFDGQTILSNINLDLNEGDVRVLMGASGSGKSTLLRCLNRLVERPPLGQLSLEATKCLTLTSMSENCVSRLDLCFNNLLSIVISQH